VAEPDYRSIQLAPSTFYAAIREYWPDIPHGSLQPAYMRECDRSWWGLGRPQAIRDRRPAAHGVAGLVNLLGIESPGLTSR
jgi:L-2-hydroxyglutarate oxidase LhgO